MPEKLKVIIADDHATTLAGIKNVAEQLNFIEVVATATNGIDARQLIKKHKTDILITDVIMEKLDGIELSKTVKKKYPSVKIIVITQDEALWTLEKLWKLDVDAIVLKSKKGNEDLRQALQKVKSGERFFSSEISEIFFKTKISAQDTPQLTGRESEVLPLICKGFTTKEIAVKLFIAKSTVEDHSKSLKLKFKVKNIAGLVREAIKLGYYNFE